MTTWVTSDTHFNHKNILKYCEATRPFATIQEMNEAMIAEWNSVVKPEDTVYHLGDVAFGGVTEAIAMLNKLNGKIILVEGNHDYAFLKNPGFRARFAEVHKLLEIKHNNVEVTMCHYPMAYWNRSHRGSVMLHGHLHDSKSGLEHLRIRNAGMDSTGKLLTKLEDIIADALTGDFTNKGD